MVCRGLRPSRLTSTASRRTTTSQRVVGYRPTYRFLPAGYPGAGQLAVVLYQKAISRPISADTLGTGFMIRAIAQRPERAIATGSPEGGGRRVLLWPRPNQSRHYFLLIEGRKRRPEWGFLIGAAPIGASIFRTGDTITPVRIPEPAAISRIMTSDYITAFFENTVNLVMFSFWKVHDLAQIFEVQIRTESANHTGKNGFFYDTLDCRP